MVLKKNMPRFFLHRIFTSRLRFLSALFAVILILSALPHAVYHFFDTATNTRVLEGLDVAHTTDSNSDDATSHNNDTTNNKDEDKKSEDKKSEDKKSEDKTKSQPPPVSTIPSSPVPTSAAAPWGTVYVPTDQSSSNYKLASVLTQETANNVAFLHNQVQNLQSNVATINTQIAQYAQSNQTQAANITQ